MYDDACRISRKIQVLEFNTLRGRRDDLKTARTLVGGVRLSWAFRSRAFFGSVYMHFCMVYWREALGMMPLALLSSYMNTTYFLP